MLNSSQISLVIDVIREASTLLLSYYRKPGLAIEEKEDQSPVSEADMASHKFISEFLQREFPDIPLISEEGVKEDYSIRKTRDYFWILDPLDGTKEFISGNDEFTINLALIYKGSPVFGIISVPVQKLVYYAIQGDGSWKISDDGVRQRLPIFNSDYLNTKKVTALISRSHAGAEEMEYCATLEKNGWQVEVRPAGSAFKHTLLAEGSAELYHKPGICWEWDTAPGQLIIQEAGGSVRRIADGAPLDYNKESFMNPGFTMWAPGVFIPL